MTFGRRFAWREAPTKTIWREAPTKTIWREAPNMLKRQTQLYCLGCGVLETYGPHTCADGTHPIISVQEYVKRVQLLTDIIGAKKSKVGER